MEEGAAFEFQFSRKLTGIRYRPTFLLDLLSSSPPPPPPVTSREPPEILFSPRDPVGRVSGVAGTKLFLIKKNRAGQKPFCRDGNQRNPRIRLFGISERASWAILIAPFASRVRWDARNIC